MTKSKILEGLRQRLPQLRDIETPLQEWAFLGQELSEQDLLTAYHEITGLDLADEEQESEMEAMDGLSSQYLLEKMLVPLSFNKNEIILAVAHPHHLAQVINHWNFEFGKEVKPVLMRRSLIERKVMTLYQQQEMNENSAGGDSLEDLAKGAPIVRLVNDVFSRAHEMGASDIHVEPGELEVQVRFRVDGVLVNVYNFAAQQAPAIISRLKLLGGVNIAESRIPQDGRLELKLVDISYDVRLSTLPGIYGESVVMRLLSKKTQSFSLEAIGMEAEICERFSQLIRRPHGLVLLVGPTGSGKTTTLYCALNLLNTGKEKIVTLEDPVEYQLSGITQVQVKPQIELTFASGLRSIVRQDPDIILVGEIRDRETADMAINAALTGHLVLSTIHTNNAAGAVSRLQDMGVESFLIASSLIAVLSQRLIRKLCSECQGEGCKTCHSTGYKGRTSIHELLEVNEDIRQAILAKQSSSQIASLARKNGMIPIVEDGFKKVALGLSSREEILRVSSIED